MVVNIASKKMSSFSDFKFLSIFSDGGVLYGVRSDGLYIIEGNSDDEAPIKVDIMSGYETVDEYHNKRVRAFYMDGVIPGNAMGVLKVDHKEEWAYPYTFRCVPGKGAVGTSFALGFKGYAPVRVSSISVVEDKLRRRRS